MKDDTFIDLLLKGEQLDTSIDDYVSEWHNGKSSLDLDEYLGMTPDEYALWVENPASLRAIVFQRMHNIQLPKGDWVEVHQLAARSASIGEFNCERLMAWLKERSYL